MRVVELTMEQLRAEALRLAELVGRDYRPDCVVYIARAGLPVARPMGPAFGAPLVEARAPRPASRLKDLAAPALQHLPLEAKCLLRRVELGLRPYAHRQALLAGEALPPGCRRVLVVDDSVDTGATLAAACQQVRLCFGGCGVRTAALNVWDKSARRVKTDYSLYRNTLLMTPLSRDWAGHPAFAEG